MKKIYLDSEAASNWDVILTNGWDRISYNILRGLAQHGLKVGFGVDHNSGMGAYSKYKTQVFKHACYTDDEEKFIQDIKKIITIHKPKVYIPTGEEVFIIAKYIEEFKGIDIKIPISDYETLHRLDDKLSSFQLARNSGIPIPVTIIPQSIDDIKYFGRQYGFPVVLKKSHSSSAKGVYYIAEPDIEKTIEELLKYEKIVYGQFIIEEFVTGTGYGVSMLFNRGKKRAIFTHKRLRERIATGGPSTIRMSTTNPELEEYAEHLLTSLKFHGVAMVEFKYDEKKKQGWFIEVNPRFWGSVGLAINSGVNFPYLLYKMALNCDLENNTGYRLDYKNIWMLGEFSAVINQIKKNKNPLIIRELFTKTDGYDDFYKDDPLPFFARIFLLIKRNICQTLKKK